MSARIQKASASLQTVLKAGNLDGMMKQLMILNAKGGLDESVVLLMEANIEQAKKAGAKPAFEVSLRRPSQFLMLPSETYHTSCSCARIRCFLFV
jgi:hypothetical protein